MKPALHPSFPPANLRAALVILSALTFAAPPAPAAVTEAWVQRCSNVVNNPADMAFKVVRDAAGDFMVVGTSYDGITAPVMLIFKYSGADGPTITS